MEPFARSRSLSDAVASGPPAGRHNLQGSGPLSVACVDLSRSACPAYRVGCVAAVHPFKSDGLGPELPPDDLALPAPVQAPADGLLEGDDEADRHQGRLGQLILKASHALTS